MYYIHVYHGVSLELGYSTSSSNFGPYKTMAGARAALTMKGWRSCDDNRRYWRPDIGWMTDDFARISKIRPRLRLTNPRKWR